MVFTIRDGDFHGLCYLLFSLLEILRPKKMDTPSLRVLDFLPFKASKKYGAPSKQNSAPWGSVHPWKIECQKETSENMHKICWQKSKRENVDTTYLLENVVKKLLVFPPPVIKGIFCWYPRLQLEEFSKRKKKLHKSSPIPWKLSSFLGVSVVHGCFPASVAFKHQVT